MSEGIGCGGQVTVRDDADDVRDCSGLSWNSLARYPGDDVAAFQACLLRNGLPEDLRYAHARQYVGGGNSQNPSLQITWMLSIAAGGRV